MCWICRITLNWNDSVAKIFKRQVNGFRVEHSRVMENSIFRENPLNSLQFSAQKFLKSEYSVVNFCYPKNQITCKAYVSSNFHPICRWSKVRRTGKHLWKSHFSLPKWKNRVFFVPSQVKQEKYNRKINLQLMWFSYLFNCFYSFYLFPE